MTRAPAIFLILYLLFGAAFWVLLDRHTMRSEVPYSQWPSGIPLGWIRCWTFGMCLAFGPFVALVAAYKMVPRHKPGDTD